MLKQFVSKKFILLYFFFIILTWLEAVINPTLVRMIVSSFEGKNIHTLWTALIFGIVGNLILLAGLTGKRYYYAKIVADFTQNIKSRIFHQFLYGSHIHQDEVLSDLENDIKQIEDTYLEPTVIIMSSLGFTIVSIIYALATNFWLGLIFIVFYSIPAMCSGIGSHQLNQLSEKKTLVNQSYLGKLTDIINGSRIIKNYQSQSVFYDYYEQELDETIHQNLLYEKQRSVNTLIINTIDVFCSVFPIIIGGFMTYNGNLSAASFIAIYLVSYNIGYQFQELSYFINTRKSSSNLQEKYRTILSQPIVTEGSIEEVFPITLKHISMEFNHKRLLSDFSLDIKSGEKIAIIGESGSGKSTLLNLIFGDIKASKGEVLFNGKALSRSQIAEKGAYILQSSYVFNGLSLEENIALQTNFDSVRMSKVIEETNLNHLREQKLSTSNLSGGEKQRIEIARSLYHQKAFILADEVKSNLDRKNAQQIEDILFSIPQTVIEVIHHYSDQSLSRYDRVINLSQENTTQE